MPPPRRSVAAPAPLRPRGRTCPWSRAGWQRARSMPHEPASGSPDPSRGSRSCPGCPAARSPLPAGRARRVAGLALLQLTVDSAEFVQVDEFRQTASAGYMAEVHVGFGANEVVG